LEKVATKGVTSLWEVTFVLILRIADKKAAASKRRQRFHPSFDFKIKYKIQNKFKKGHRTGKKECP
jgi:hypothetical protein